MGGSGAMSETVKFDSIRGTQKSERCGDILHSLEVGLVGDLAFCSKGHTGL